MQDIDCVLYHLHAEDVAVEVDGLSAVAHLEHPVQGASAELQSHLLYMYCHLQVPQQTRLVRGGLKIINETGVMCNIYLVL